MTKQIKATVHGRVQGVFFRDTTRREAQRLGITGWVKNERDGTVSVTAAGPEDKLKQLIQFLHHGSPQAEVTQVDVTWSDGEREYEGFSVRW